MATFAISDIHGRLQELELLLGYIECSSTDTVIFLGDYIDRGPDSNKVIERLIEIESAMPNTSFLKGNHEEMAISSKTDSDVRKLWMKYGGDKTLESYPDGIPREHWSFMYRLEKFVETDDSIFVHAGLDENLAMEEQDNEVLIWKRLNSPLHHYSNKKIYCGHSKQRSGLPALFGSARCIDCSGWLTAIDVDTDRVYQINNVGNRRDFVINE